MTATGPSAPAWQRSRRGVIPVGGGSLAVMLVLLLGASLVLLYANRALIFEQRSAANQVRATMALEAAEAGVQWALARLNHRRGIDASCNVSATAGSATFAERLLQFDAASGTLGTGSASSAACVATSATGWQCQCPASGAAALAATGATVDSPAFAVAMAAGPRPGTAWLRSTGCAGLGAACAGVGPIDAGTRVEVLVATIDPLARRPYAAVTALGDIALQGLVRVTIADAGGLAVATAANATLEPPVNILGAPGSLASDGVLTQDPTWRDASGGIVPASLFFARHFGFDAFTLRALPTVTPLSCGAGCSSTDLVAALDTGARVVWIDGPLALGSAVTLGSAERPVVVIVRGALTITGAIQVRGLVYAGSVQWTGPGASPARLDGALVSEGTVLLAGRIDVSRDTEVLARLSAAGVHAPVPGSWRDTAD